MDPVSAVTFAATILTFVDFSWNLVKGSYQVYQSATTTTTDDARLSTILADLENVTDNLQYNITGSSPHLEDLRQLAAGCAEVSRELSSILEKLKRKEGNKVWRSLEATWRHMRKEKEVAAIEGRLNTYRLQLLLRLNLIFRGLSLSEKSLDNLTNLASSVTDLEKKLIKELSELVRNNNENESSLAEIRGSLSAILSQMKAIPKLNTAEECILRRLYFPSMHSRLDTVSEAEIGTFAWLLEDEEDEVHSVKLSPAETIADTSDSSIVNQGETNEQDTDSKRDKEFSERAIAAGVNHSITNKSSIKRSDEQRMKQQVRQPFLAWLSSGDGIYHISGKAGSGKSTLVKFLCQNPRLNRELERWAGNNLVFANFFFWASGNKLQRSLEGLYRSLLFEILNQCPELIDKVLPDQWAKMKSNPTKWAGMPFLFSELRQAMETITTKCSFPHHRFFFFIDGLDEYEGDRTDHLDLARNLKNWSFSADMKMCVSSRPHTEFLNVFDSDLQMHLHHLTRADIELFTMATFEKESNFDNKDEKSRNIVQDIVDSADGVFLWVRLVVRSLLNGFRHRYPVAYLKQKLEKMPRELDILFDKIFNSIDSGDREKSDKMLLLAATYPNLDVLMFSWLDDLEDPDFPFNAPIQAYSDVEIRDRHEVVRLQLDGLCKGLLEITENGRRGRTEMKDIYFGYEVQFFHRTVGDYVKEPARYAEIEGRLRNFDIQDAYRRLLLAEFRFARTMEEYFKNQGLGPIALVSCFADCFFDRVADHVPLRLLKEYEKILDHHRRQPFSFPGETKDNLGVIAWSQCFQSDYCNGHLSNDDISYLHWTASYDQREYVIDQVSSNPSLVNTTDDGRSLLLTAAISTSSGGLVRDLLKYGASPRHQVPVNYPGGSCPASIWAVFLFIVARRRELRYRKHLEGMFWAMEEFLKSGADSNVYFLLQPKSRYDLERRLDSLGACETLSDDDVCFITLEDLIVTARPANMDTLLRLILDAKRPGLWNGTLRALAGLTLWTGSSNDVQSRYKRARLDELDWNWSLQSVVVGGEKLRGGFDVKWF
ncbi:hypothetical protein ZTR_05452 [Talaromyces verruculosus]|nr:hypothetical protein ZTR_05452 [Talaromyces verruculosus]